MTGRVTDSAFLQSLAQRMHDLSVAQWSPDEPYPRDGSLALPAVMLGELGDDPVRAVAVVLYDTDPDIFTVEYSPLHRVQLAWRADSRQTALDDADRGFEALHSLTPGLWPGGVAPLWVLRTVNGKPDPDNGTWIKADSYDIRLN